MRSSLASAARTDDAGADLLRCRDARCAGMVAGERPMHTLRSRSTTVRLAWGAVDRDTFRGAELARLHFAARLQLLSADCAAGRALPVMVVDRDARRAWIVARGTRALADDLMPAMRPLSLGVALGLAGASLAYPPLAVAAAVYAGFRVARRELERRSIHCAIESFLHRTLIDTARPAAG
jgi:hypothetical protein